MAEIVIRIKDWDKKGQVMYWLEADPMIDENTDEDDFTCAQLFAMRIHQFMYEYIQNKQREA